MFCTKCGSPIPEGNSFCTNCGAPAGSVAERVSSAAESPSVTPAADAAPAFDPVLAQTQDVASTSKDRRPLVIGIIVAAALLIIGAIVAVVLLFGQPSSSDSNAADGAAEGNSNPQATPVSMFVSQIDNAAFPKVSLYASLTDQSGAQLGSVDKTQFSVVEVGSDGTEYQATIDEILPMSEGDMMNINLVLDQSGSMGGEGKMSNAKTAAHAFIDKIAESGSNSAEITSFDDSVYNVQPFTTNATLLDSAVDSLRPDGDTALYDALYWALQRTNMKSGARVVIGFTDGVENASVYSRADVEELSHLTGIPVYLVGIGDENDYSELRSLAEACNGQYFDASTSDLASALERIYESIYQDQRSMYRITYTSSFQDETDSFRTVRLSGADGSSYSGSTETTYVPVDNVSSYDNSGNLNAYVLPDSSSRYYSRAELEDLSLWELYLARNEIFARYGRGFKNQDLVDYFSSRSWYSQRYTPEEFDAMGSPLNDYEQKNTQLMLEIERERNSPYLHTDTQ